MNLYKQAAREVIDFFVNECLQWEPPTKGTEDEYYADLNDDEIAGIIKKNMDMQPDFTIAPVCEKPRDKS